MNRSGLLTWLGLLASFALLSVTAPAFAQAGNQVVSSCGGVNYPVGPVRPGTQDTTGKLCTSGSGGGGGGVVTGNQSNAGAGTTGSANVGTNSYTYGWQGGATWAQAVVDGSGRWLVAGAGTAGTPAGGVLTIQGVASMTPLLDTSTGATVTTAHTCSTAGYTRDTCLGQIDDDVKGSIPTGPNQIGNLIADTHAQCSALCSNLVVKGSAGTLKTFEVSADSTLAGAIWYVMVFDATSLPADGAVTPAKCYQQASGTTQMGGTLSTGGSAFATGIVISVSTTGCFTKTASIHAFVGADFQ